MKTRKTSTAVAVAVAVTLALMAVLGAGAAALAASEPTGGSRAEVGVFLPGTPPPGLPAEGDQFLTVDPVLDPGTGEQIGTAVTRVVVAQVVGDDATVILDCTVRLPEGNLAFYGAESFSSFADGVTYTVVGGTGRYQGTGGVVNITGSELGGRAGSLLSFDITRR